MHTDLRLYFIFLYLAVDICYVLASKGFYETAIRRIQGSGFPKGRMWAAFVAWGSLALGWAVLAAPAAVRWMESGTPPLLAGAAAGAVFGFVLYAIYNMLLFIQFQNYTLDVVWRDVLWGTAWAAVLTAAYTAAVARMKK